MKPHERLIVRVGFYKADTPTFEYLRHMLAEAAYYCWQQTGKPADECWIECEKRMFGPMQQDGYCIFICDMDNPKNQGMYQFWDQVIIKPERES